jgi:dTDP-4-amino-4,6-dideoxygalactose transaminase
MKKYTFLNLATINEPYFEEIKLATSRIIESGRYIGGEEVANFEQNLATICNAPYAIGVSNGLDALRLIIRGYIELGIFSKGDEIIVPANTYIASVIGITENGATPVLVEPDAFFELNADLIEAAITEKTKAILPVHLYGQPCDMKKICEIAKKHNLYVIEDCAQSHGAKFEGRYTGTFGTIGCFSFYPTKPLGALGDSGALITNDEEIAKRLRAIRNYGSAKKYVNEISGVNSRLDEVQAAVLQVGITHLEEGNNYRYNIAQKYLQGIKCSYVELPKCKQDSTHVFHVFALLCKNRDALQKHLQENGIDTLVHYPIPPHMQECYKHLGFKEGDFPISERYAKEELSLPIYAGMPDEEVDYVISVVNNFKGE